MLLRLGEKETEIEHLYIVPRKSKTREVGAQATTNSRIPARTAEQRVARDFFSGGGLNLFIFGGRIAFDVSTSMRADRELEPIAFKLTTVGDRLHRGSVLVQKVDLFE